LELKQTSAWEVFNVALTAFSSTQLEQLAIVDDVNSLLRKQGGIRMLNEFGAYLIWLASEEEKRLNEIEYWRLQNESEV